MHTHIHVCAHTHTCAHPQSHAHDSNLHFLHSQQRIRERTHSRPVWAHRNKNADTWSERPKRGWKHFSSSLLLAMFHQAFSLLTSNIGGGGSASPIVVLFRFHKFFSRHRSRQSQCIESPGTVWFASSCAHQTFMTFLTANSYCVCHAWTYLPVLLVLLKVCRCFGGECDCCVVGAHTIAWYCMGTNKAWSYTNVRVNRQNSAPETEGTDCGLFLQMEESHSPRPARFCQGGHRATDCFPVTISARDRHIETA